MDCVQLVACWLVPAMLIPKQRDMHQGFAWEWSTKHLISHGASSRSWSLAVFRLAKLSDVVEDRPPW